MKKQGTGRVLAAVGPNADAFAPPAATGFDFVNQIPPSKFPVFSLTGSNAHSTDIEMAHTSPELPRLPFHFAGLIRPGGKSFPAGIPEREQRICIVCTYVLLIWYGYLPSRHTHPPLPKTLSITAPLPIGCVQPVRTVSPAAAGNFHAPFSLRSVC